MRKLTMRRFISGSLVCVSLFVSLIANATLIQLSNCTGANTCTITTTPPNPIVQNPNNGLLLAWDEVQNFTLTQDLVVDRVFDVNASFIQDIGGGQFIIKAGTIVSSHYLQWDPGNGSDGRVNATIELDSQAFAFITSDQALFNSDFLGLPGLDYADFGLRGLEGGDTTDFNGPDVDISWAASSPGDWTRLITAFSPGGTPSGIPEPGTLLMLSICLLYLARRVRARRKKPDSD